MTYCFVKMQRLVMFVGVLQEKVDDNENVNTAIILVHKLVSVLESIEKVPVLLYDSPGSCYGLQVSSRIYRTIPSFTLPNVLEVNYYKILCWFCWLKRLLGKETDLPHLQAS